MSEPHRVLLVGATGMVGAQVAALLPAAALTVIARRKLDLADGAQLMVAPSDEWPGLIAAAKPAVVVNALGTTIRQAGSQSAFRAVDHDLVLDVAKVAKVVGASHFILVSSVGASVTAGNFYLRTKGDVEVALDALDFARLDVFRPGLLTGARSGPARLGEAAAMLAAPVTDALLHGSLRRYRSIPAATVAKAIVALTKMGGSGTHVHEHDGIVQLAD